MKDSVGIIPQAKFLVLTQLQPSQYIRTAINLILGFAGVAAFISLLWGGVQWIMSGGEKEHVEAARKRLISALIGLSLVFSSYALLFIIRALFGIDVIGFNLGKIK